MVRSVNDRLDKSEQREDVFLDTLNEVNIRSKGIAAGFTKNFVNMAKIIPFENSEEILSFVRQDDLYEERIEALTEWIRGKAEQSSVSKLVQSLTTGLFDPDYRATMRWPSTR